MGCHPFSTSKAGLRARVAPGFGHGRIPRGDLEAPLAFQPGLVGDLAGQPLGHLPVRVLHHHTGVVAADADLPLLRARTHTIHHLLQNASVQNYQRDAQEGRGRRFGGFLDLSDGMLVGGAVARATLDGTRLTGLQVIWRQTPKQIGRGHFGHRIAFGTDGTLFITSGDRMRFDPAQDAVLGQEAFADFGTVAARNLMSSGPSAGTATSLVFAALLYLAITLPLTQLVRGAVQSASEGSVETVTLGFFGQQQVAFNNRLFLTGALRGDEAWARPSTAMAGMALGTSWPPPMMARTGVDPSGFSLHWAAR